MIVYFDTSALVKRYISETGSDDVVSLVDQTDVIGSIVLTRVEMAAALEKAFRFGGVPRDGIIEVWQDFLDHWLSFTRLNISPGTIDRACMLAWDYSLCGCDAIHLAAALLWQEALSAPILLATFDTDLWLAGQKAGLHVWPEDRFT